ncbi:DUF4241 domain-containing protein [Paenibacillus doosanensis]|uniref:DUF4241 domain-containing protein n=1 Tax=Paenibacillus doosanensis TaxID=1229154 RepID=UPI00217F8960|nr:DUF4241 domain-containing protein [Paenibacillus doosanensis]MCS7460498.1 DUF4241 domain-containing protein [Paenibacillus doosanensis]
MMIHLGNFEVASGELVVADPCYEADTNTIIMGVLDHVQNGTWSAYVDKTEVRDWGEACSRLIACHSSCEDNKEELFWVKTQFIVGVDSGQAGIFDSAKYRIPDAGAKPGQQQEMDSDWYLACCDITESGHEAGVMDGGVVSRTGIGDGAYGAYTASNEQGQIVGVKIVFIKGNDW